MKNIMLITVACLVMVFQTKAQYLSNPSFNLAGSFCAGNCTGESAPPWRICKYSPDFWITNSCINISPIEGNSFLALASIYDGGSQIELVEQVGQKLQQPLVKNVRYYFSGYFSEFNRPCNINNDTSDLYFELWLGNDSCQTDTMVLELLVKSLNSFEKLSGNFYVNEVYNWITLTHRSAIGGAKYLLIDALELVENPETGITNTKFIDRKYQINLSKPNSQ